MLQLWKTKENKDVKMSTMHFFTSINFFPNNVYNPSKDKFHT